MKNYVLFASLMLFSTLSFAASETGCANGKPPHCGGGHSHGHGHGHANGHGHGNSTNTNTNTNTNSNSNTNSNTNSNSNTNTVSGGSASVNYEYREVRQAPAVGQGSFAIQGCAVAGNVGGSNSNGAAFLGLGWTPDECYDFMLAQAYQSLGRDKAACQVLNMSKAGQRAKKRGIELPTCEPEVVRTETISRSIEAPAAPVAPTNFLTKEEAANFVTRDEVIERDDRVLKAATSK